MINGDKHINHDVYELLSYKAKIGMPNFLLY